MSARLSKDEMLAIRTVAEEHAADGIAVYAMSNKRVLVLLDTLEAQERALAEAKSIMEEVVLHAPDDESGYACMFCDMGGAGYSSRGDGFHDDKEPYVCSVHRARAYLAAHADGVLKGEAAEILKEGGV